MCAKTLLYEETEHTRVHTIIATWQPVGMVWIYIRQFGCDSNFCLPTCPSIHNQELLIVSKLNLLALQLMSLTLTMTESSKAYELLTKTVFEELAKLEGWKTLEVMHDKILKSPTGAEHQIDVYIRYELLGREQEIVIECKNFQTPVDKPRLMAFVGVVKDLMGVQGLLVTRKGFDVGNIAPIAKAHNIGLYTLDETNNFEFSATLSQQLAQIVQLALEPTFDQSKLRDIEHVRCEDMIVYDKSDSEIGSLQRLMDEAFDQMVVKNLPVGEYLSYDLQSSGETYLKARNVTMEKIRILGVVFQRQSRSYSEGKADIRMTHLLQVVTSNKKYYVTQEGKIYRAGDELLIPIDFKSVDPKGEDVIINIITQIPD